MRILVVENDLSLAASLARSLRSDGHVVDFAPSNAKAVAAVKQHRFGMLIVQLGQSAQDDVEVLHNLRISGQRLPVLALSTRDTVSARMRSLELGSDDFMATPFTVQQLAARVRALVRKSQTRSKTKLVFGLLTMDPSARRVQLAGKDIELTAREWAVLEVLLERARTIVSGESVIDAVVGSSGRLSRNAVQVYISRLRSKLGSSGVTIRTVRGLGYMLKQIKSR